MSFERISDDCIAWTSNGTGLSPTNPTCPHCAELKIIAINSREQVGKEYKARRELEAKLARAQAKSARRRKALHELNKAMRIANLMVVTQIGRNRALNEKFAEKPGVLKRLWRKIW